MSKRANTTDKTTADQHEFWPSRRWWLGLLAILLLAGVLRFIGYNFSLPYIDHPDEPTFFLTALEWRGLFSINDYIAGYPPLYIWLQMLAQTGGGLDEVAQAVGTFRLISAVFSLVTLALIALTAWRIMGEWAGWTAGVGWAVAPLVVENAIYATPDPLLYLLVALAIWLAVEALYGRPTWALWSVVAGCLAILTKYYVLTAVLPGLGAAATFAWRDRRRGLKLIGLQTLLIAAAISFAAVAVLTMPREAATARESGLANALNPGRVLNNLYYAFFPLAPVAFVIYSVTGVLAWFAAPHFKVPRARPIPVLLVMLTAVTIPWLASTFSLVSPITRMKDVLPATVGMCILLGVAVGQIAALAPARRQWASATVTLLPLLVLIWPPQIRDSMALIQNRLLPDNRVALRQWADAAVEPGTVLVGRENEKTFNPNWGGIEAAHWFDWWETASMPDRTAAQWRAEHGISYAVVGQSVWDEMAQNEVGRAWRDSVLPLRTFLGPSRGPEMTFVRLWRPKVETDVQFGDSIRLAGYDMSAIEVTSGESVTLRFYWNAVAPPAANYSLFVHLLPEGGGSVPLAQADGAPASSGRPALLWNDPSETIISDPFILTVPADLPPGTYAIHIGLYNPDTGARLLVTGSNGRSVGDSLPLTTLEIMLP